MFGLLGDIGDLPPLGSADFQIFSGGGAINAAVAKATRANSHVWNKMRGASMVYMFGVGAGGGGGGGQTGLTNTQRAGGGGGGPGSTFSLLIPAMFLPESLFLSLGFGGAGGAAGVNGNSGGGSEIGYPAAFSASIDGTLLAMTGGGGGSAGAGGTGGAAGSGPLAVAENTIFNCGIFQTFVSTGGASGGGNGTGSQSGQTLFMGGSGGGGVSTGNVAADGGTATVTGGLRSVFPEALGGTGNNAAVGGSGKNGYFQFNPMLTSGAAGGGGSGNNTGGKGGDVWGPGCGGGGGGGGITGGLGGRGGNAMVIILTW